MFSNKISKYICFSIISVIFLCFVWSIAVEPNLLVVNRQEINIPNLPNEYQNTKILVLGDIHAGSLFIDSKKLEKIVELSNKEHPDLVLLLGDFEVTGGLGSHFVPTEFVASKLSKIQASYGKISVLGNHEWWNDGEKARQGLLRNGIKVLENNSINIAAKDKPPFWVAGAADLTTRIADLKSTLSGINNDDFVILLTHTPDIFPEVPTSVDLTLAGHVHGGQVRLPFVGARVTPSIYGNRYSKGLISENGKKLFVTTGIGTSIMPIRFLCPPEVVILTLKKG